MIAISLYHLDHPSSTGHGSIASQYASTHPPQSMSMSIGDLKRRLHFAELLRRLLPFPGPDLPLLLSPFSLPPACFHVPRCLHGQRPYLVAPRPTDSCPSLHALSRPSVLSWRNLLYSNAGTRRVRADLPLYRMSSS